MAQSRREQLLNFIPSYRAGYVSSGGKDDDLRDEEALIQKMDEHQVNNEAEAERAGREDGYAWRNTH